MSLNSKAVYESQMICNFCVPQTLEIQCWKLVTKATYVQNNEVI